MPSFLTNITIINLFRFSHLLSWLRHANHLSNTLMPVRCSHLRVVEPLQKTQAAYPHFNLISNFINCLAEYWTASLQATVDRTENFKRPKGRGVTPSSALWIKLWKLPECNQPCLLSYSAPFVKQCCLIWVPQI